MTLSAQRNLMSFLVGILFSVGLSIGGMTQPQKVIGFLNLQSWDPALLFVMIGAIGVHAFSFPFIMQRTSPLLDTKWHVPPRGKIRAKLLVGASIFGVGWGLAGYCPGPAVVALTSGDSRAIVFVGSMLVGMFVFVTLENFILRQRPALS